LPLMAAGIRRIRPKPVPWRRNVFLFLLAVAAGVIAFRLWIDQDRPAPSRQVAASAPKADTAPPSQSTPPAEVRDERGTSGHVQTPELPTVKQNTSSAPVDEDVVVRQTIERFEGTYRSRWGGLAFEHCDISRKGDDATAICVPRTADGSS